MADDKKKKRKTKTGNVGGCKSKIVLTEKDYEQIVKLGARMWSKDEIAAFFNMSPDTLVARIKEDHDVKYEDFVKMANDQGRGRLRSAMWDTALGKDGEEVTEEETGRKVVIPKVAPDKIMQIYLSKNYLGMTDKTDIDLKGNVTINIDGKLAKL